jgi:hypothetical protein
MTFREALIHAGCRKEAIRARISLIAYERRLPQDETERALRGVTKPWRADNPTIVFARAHSISLDWIFDGNLRGLLRTACYRNCTPLPEKARGR